MRPSFDWLTSPICDRLKQLNSTRSQISNYASVIGWIIQDTLRQFWPRILAIFLLDIVGTISAAGAFGSVIAYVRQLTDGQPIVTFNSITLDLEQPQILASFAGLAAVFGLLSAASQYFAVIYIAQTVVDYRQACVTHLVELAKDIHRSGWPKVVAGQPLRLIHESFSLLLPISYVLRRLLMVFAPFFTFIFALGCLLWVSATLTLLLAPICLVYLVFIYRQTQRIVILETSSQAINRKVRETALQTFRTAVSQDLPHSLQGNTQDGLLLSEDYKELSNIFKTRFTVIGQVRFANNALFISCTVSLFVFFAIATPNGDRNWSDLLVYLFALRFTFSGLQQISTSLTQILRIFPVCSLYVNFVRTIDRHRKHQIDTMQRFPSVTDLESFEIQYAASSLLNKSERVQVSNPALIWVILPYRLLNGDLKATALRLEQSLSPLVSLVGDTDYIEAVHAINSEQPLRNIEAAIASPSSFPKIGTQPVAFLDTTLIFQEDQETLQTYLERYRRIFLVTHDPERLLKARGICSTIRKRTTGVVILNDLNVVGGGSLYWLIDNLESVRAYLDEQQNADSAGWDILDDEMGF
jgi:ABC-type multidrug transport system fused ATPase/permease subunit